MLLQNRQGKTRLSKWYVDVEEEEKRKIEGEVYRLTTSRDAKFTNFIEVRGYSFMEGTYWFCLWVCVSEGACVCLQYKTYKLIYRRYAGLYFIMCVEVHDNELGILENIHLFVEILDNYFGNVCELDLVFNFNKVSANVHREM